MSILLGDNFMDNVELVYEDKDVRCYDRCEFAEMSGWCDTYYSENNTAYDGPRYENQCDTTCGHNKIINDFFNQSYYNLTECGIFANYSIYDDPDTNLPSVINETSLKDCAQRFARFQAALAEDRTYTTNMVSNFTRDFLFLNIDPAKWAVEIATDQELEGRLKERGAIVHLREWLDHLASLSQKLAAMLARTGVHALQNTLRLPASLASLQERKGNAL